LPWQQSFTSSALQQFRYRSFWPCLYFSCLLCFIRLLVKFGSR
jgi:hypothetical protein